MIKGEIIKRIKLIEEHLEGKKNYDCLFPNDSKESLNARLKELNIILELLSIPENINECDVKFTCPKCKNKMIIKNVYHEASTDDYDCVCKNCKHEEYFRLDPFRFD